MVSRISFWLQAYYFWHFFVLTTKGEKLKLSRELYRGCFTRVLNYVVWVYCNFFSTSNISFDSLFNSRKHPSCLTFRFSGVKSTVMFEGRENLKSWNNVRIEVSGRPKFWVHSPVAATAPHWVINKNMIDFQSVLMACNMKVLWNWYWVRQTYKLFLRTTVCCERREWVGTIHTEKYPIWCKSLKKI